METFNVTTFVDYLRNLLDIGLITPASIVEQMLTMGDEHAAVADEENLSDDQEIDQHPISSNVLGDPDDNANDFLQNADEHQDNDEHEEHQTVPNPAQNCWDNNSKQAFDEQQGAASVQHTVPNPAPATITRVIAFISRS